MTNHSTAPRDVLHAYEITPNDAALIRMMAGAKFGPDATIGLPSGIKITGSEMRRWLDATNEQDKDTDRD